jgi:hypothetical protein
MPGSWAGNFVNQTTPTNTTMSRSNPEAHAQNPHPCRRWFEWNGDLGRVRYYDKDAKENIDCGPKVAFVVLDALKTVKGYNEKIKSGITANEVRDTRTDILSVRSFAGGPIATGLWSDIKEKVENRGGSFAVNLYVAFKLKGELLLGSFMCRGAALGAWFDFEKENRDAVWSKGVMIDGSTGGKVGKIEFRIPTFKIIELDNATDECAKSIDSMILQPYLKKYLGTSRKGDPVDQSADYDPASESQEQGEPGPEDLRGGHYEEPSHDEPRRGLREGNRPSQQSAPPPQRRPVAEPDLDAPEDDIPF